MSRTLLSLVAVLTLVATTGPAPARAATIDVMTYNIRWGAPSGRRLDTIARVIASSGADVAGLQEVRRFTRNASGGDYRCEDQAAKLVSSLKRITGQTWHWAYAANYSRRQSSRHCRAVTSKNREEGVLIVSRYPIVKASSYRLPYARALAKATIDTPGAGRATVYSTHLDWGSDGKRSAQARQILSITRSARGPIFLTGDMNSLPKSTAMRTLAQGGLHDTWADKGVGKGATRRARIDYIWYAGGSSPQSVRVIQTNASDHRPVVGRFTVE